MIKSMTGYGRGEILSNNRKISVEIKSVNHRYNDVNIKMPKILNMFGEQVRKLANQSIFRGKTDIFIHYDSFSPEDIEISIHESLASSYLNALSQLESISKLTVHAKLDLLAKFPDVIMVERSIKDEKEIEELLHQAFQEALQSHLSMRLREGEALKINLIEKMIKINQLITEIETRYPKVLIEYKEKLQLKINELLKNASCELDENRIITEVAIMAEKTDVDEEIIRFKSHINQFNHLLQAETPVGRNLDFLVQEMNREANTIVSKSNDLEITQYCLLLKSEIEKIREQVQNIE